jgi:hypothetical protein
MAGSLIETLLGIVGAAVGRRHEIVGAGPSVSTSPSTKIL